MTEEAERFQPLEDAGPIGRLSDGVGFSHALRKLWANRSDPCSALDTIEEGPDVGVSRALRSREARTVKCAVPTLRDPVLPDVLIVLDPLARSLVDGKAVNLHGSQHLDLGFVAGILEVIDELVSRS